MQEKSNQNLEKLVKKSNRLVYNQIKPDDYEKNPSLFNEQRQKECEINLKFCAEKSGIDSYLDLGTGTGNLLRISQKFFKKIYAVDISENILLKIKDKHPRVYFVAADAEELPFQNETFNCISANALLHHLVSHEKLFQEIYRILKKNGTVYTDHDPNYFFNRFYHPFYKIKYFHKHGFGSQINDLAEYHHVFTPGINPEKLKKTLEKIGFSNVQIQYHLTSRSEWKGFAKFAFACLKILSALIPIKSLKTHFSIIAQK